MHDIHVANKVQKLILEQAENSGLKNVKKIEIELGSIEEHGSDITAENLGFNLKMLTQGTIAEGLQINIKKVPGNDWQLISISGDEK